MIILALGSHENDVSVLKMVRGTCTKSLLSDHSGPVQPKALVQRSSVLSMSVVNVPRERAVQISRGGICFYQLILSSEFILFSQFWGFWR